MMIELKEVCITEKRLHEIIREIALSEPSRQPTMYTGYGGMMMYTFMKKYWIYGRSKMPRKMKKRIFGTKKDRLQYLPEYYLKVKPKKGRNY